MKALTPALDVTGVTINQTKRTKPWMRKPVKCYELVHPEHGVIAVLRSRKRAEKLLADAVAGDITVHPWPPDDRYIKYVEIRFYWDDGGIMCTGWDELL